MPYITVPRLGHRLHYVEFAPEKTDRPPVVFLHGFTLDHRMWLENAGFFSHDYRVLILDSKGHGKSDAPPTGYSRRNRVEDLLAFADELKLDKMHLVGLSMGGSTAIGFALDHADRLASLTLVDSGAAGYSIGKGISHIDRLAREEGLEVARQRWIDTTLRWYKGHQQDIRDRLLSQMREHSGAIWLDQQRGKYPREYDLENAHRITIPTMIMVGALDRIFVPLSEQLHERIEGSRYEIFEGAGHMLNLETPDRFNAELKAFLEGVASSESD